METHKASLLILAAGMGSRYGALKQMDAFGPNGETIIDYSLHDALEAGFKKIVFVIRKSFEQEFKEKMVATGDVVEFIAEIAVPVNADQVEKEVRRGEEQHHHGVRTQNSGDSLP